MKNTILKHQSGSRNGACCTTVDEISGRPQKKRCVIKQDSWTSWLVCCSAALSNVIVVGYSYSFGVLFPPLLEHFKEDKATTAWVGSLYMSLSFLLGPVAAKLCDRYGCRVTSIIGSATCVLGLVLTSQAPSILCMYLTYSVIVGFGSCCVYTSSFVVVPRYFVKRRSLATGLVCCGPAGGSLVMGPLLQLLLDCIGWRKTFLAMAGMVSLVCFLALTFDSRTAKEISASTPGEMGIPTKEAKSGKGASFLKSPVLIVQSISCAALFLGMYNPQVILVKYAEQQGISADNSALFFFYMGLASTAARLLTGPLCDYKCVSPQTISQVALYISGSAICLLPLANTYERLVLYSIVYGFCDGSFGCTMNIQILTCVESHHTAKAYGFYLGVTSPSIAVGPPFAGFLADYMNSYAPAFYVSASAVFVGATLPFMLYCTKRKGPFDTPEISVEEQLPEITLLEKETVL